MKSLKELILEKIKVEEKVNIIYDPKTIDDVENNISYLGIDFNGIEITKDLIVNFRGDLTLKKLDINKLPFKMGVVRGDFRCIDCPITTLAGFPQTVEGDFIIEFLDLDDSLEGGPTNVGGGYRVVDCNLKSLKGAPRLVKGSFISHNNSLNDVAGSLKRVRGNFVCTDNKGKKFTESEIRSQISVDGKVVF